MLAYNVLVGLKLLEMPDEDQGLRYWHGGERYPAIRKAGKRPKATPAPSPFEIHANDWAYLVFTQECACVFHEACLHESMQAAQWLGSFSRNVLSWCWLLALAWVFAPSGTLAATVPGGTNQSVAVVLTVEGRVEVLPPGGKAWVAAAAGQRLEVGHQLRTGPRSRATVGLSKLDIVRVGESMEYELRPSPTPGGKPIFEIKAGSAYFFGREPPKELRLRTRVVSGAILGTEFHVTVEPGGRTTLLMLDGLVELTNAQGSLEVKAGEAAVVEEGRPPARTAAITATNLVQWNLYYPAVLDPAELGLGQDESDALAGSLAAYREGALLEALAAYPAGRQPGSAAERVYLAGLLLAVGLSDQSEALLAAAPDAGDKAVRLGGALREMIAAVRLAGWDRREPPRFASEFLAESYYRQSLTQLPEALAAARSAVGQSPSFGFAWERVAELEFSFGRIGAAREALDRSLSLTPRNAQGVALRGFLLSAQDRIHEALATFDRAIAMDGALANAWLGRGLCRIRRGDLDGGRADLQVAAALEPNRALLRSYLGKAFSQTRDEPRAEHELLLARSLDRQDPTGPLYLALLHQRDNRINEAVRELEESQNLNDNRGVYRGRMLLDEDAAVRGVNLANIYRDVGMEEVSAHEASRAVNSDYGNYSAHLFLADSYNQMRDPRQINLRYETPWLSEYLLANLLSPVSAGTLSQTVSQQEYSKLFERDGLGFVSSTDYSSRGNWSQAAAQYGTFGSLGYALGEVYGVSSGWRPNNDQVQRTFSAEFKQQIGARDTIFVQALEYDASGGDLRQYYDPGSAHPGLRTRETQEPLVIFGYHHEWGPGLHTVAVAGRFDDTSRTTDPAQPLLLLAKDNAGQVVLLPAPALPTASLDYETKTELYSAEAQQIWATERHGVVVGLRYQTGDFATREGLGQSTATYLANLTAVTSKTWQTPAISSSGVTALERITGYGYYSWRPLAPLQLNAGVSYDRLRYPVNFSTAPLVADGDARDQVSPKAGFTWTPARNAVVRFAYTRSLGGVSFDQSVRLEPSQVAGFNQAFRSLIPEAVAGSTAAARFETFGLALERRWGTGAYLTLDADLLDSDVTQRVGAWGLRFPGSFTATSTPQVLAYEEKSLGITLNQLLGDEWSVGARYQLTHAGLDTSYPEIPPSVSLASQTRSDGLLHELGLFVVFNHASGFFARMEGLWRGQDSSGYQADPSADFWQGNLWAGYRFWRRHAQARIGVVNVTGQDYRLSPLTLYNELPRQRTFVAAFQFSL